MKLTKVLILICLFSLITTGQAMAQEQPDIVATRAGFAKTLDDHDGDAMVTFLTEDFVFDWVGLGQFVGPDQWRAVMENQYVISSDWHTDEGNVHATDNMVVVEHVALGTQNGPMVEFPGLPPSGNSWTWPHIDIYEFEGDKIKHLISYGDIGGVYMQWGLMPAPDMPEFVPTIPVPDPDPTGLSPLEANADNVQRWNSHDAASVTKLYDTNMQMFVGPIRTALDRSAMTAMNEMFFVGFPDTVLEIVRVINLGNGWVVTELLATATHQSAFMSVPPMGYPTELKIAWLMHYNADGLLTEGSFYYDNLTLMTQMTEAPYSPDGNWVITIPTPIGNQTVLHTINPQTRMGGSFSGVMNLVNENPTFYGMFPEVDGSSAWITQTVQTGRNTYKTTMMVYGTKKGEGPMAETVLISIGHGDWTITGPDTNNGDTLYCIYLAEQDVDDDGFPDEGQDPVYSDTFSFTSRRFTVMTPPMPSP